MVYQKQTWHNFPPNSTTPLSASRLNHLETQFDEAKEYVDGLIPEVQGFENPIDPRVTVALAGGRSVVAFAGSSTTSIGAYPAAFAGVVQGRWRSGACVTLEAAASANLGDGLHIVNAGQSGRNSTNYMADGRGAAISALNPSIVVHTIGSNDWNNRRDPVNNYANNIDDAINALSSDVPMTHILVHQHERVSYQTPNPYVWDDYRDALRDLAESRNDCIFVDASEAMRSLGVGVGRDNRYGLLSGDGVHLTDRGSATLGNIVAQELGLLSGGATRWNDVSIPDATGVCQWRYNSGNVELRFDLTFSTAIPVDTNILKFSIPDYLAPPLNSQISVGATGGAPYGGYVGSDGGVRLTNRSVSPRARFWGLGAWALESVEGLNR